MLNLCKVLCLKIVCFAWNAVANTVIPRFTTHTMLGTCNIFWTTLPRLPTTHTVILSSEMFDAPQSNTHNDNYTRRKKCRSAGFYCNNQMYLVGFVEKLVFWHFLPFYILFTPYVRRRSIPKVSLKIVTTSHNDLHLLVIANKTDDIIRYSLSLKNILCHFTTTKQSSEK